MGKRNLTITMRAKNAMKRGLGRARASLRKFGKNVKGIGAGIGRIFKGMMKGVLAFGGAIAVAVREGYRFKQGMAEVSTMLGDQQHLLKGMTDDIRIMSAEFGMAKDSLTKGLYDILSAGIDASGAIEVLEVATKSAVGGVTDTATAVDALTTVLNAYDMEAEEAGHVSDVLFQIVRDGKITFGQLAENIGKLAPTAKAAGVSLENMGAIVASIVKVEKPERAMTAIRAAMMKMAESGEDLVDFVRRFRGADMGEIMGAGITRRAAVGIAILTGNVDALNGELEQFQNVAGAADKAFERMNKVRQYEKIWQAFRSTLSRVGETIQDKVAPVLDKLNKSFITWAKGGGLEVVASKIKTILDDAQTLIQIIAKGGQINKDRDEAFKLIGSLLKSSLMVAGEKVVSLLKSAAPTIGKLIGQAAQVAWTVFKSGRGSKEEEARAAKQLGIKGEEKKIYYAGFGPAETMTIYTKEQKKQIKQQIKQNRLQKEYKELGLGVVKQKKEETAWQQKLRLDREKLQKLIERQQSRGQGLGGGDTRAERVSKRMAEHRKRYLEQQKQMDKEAEESIEEAEEKAAAETRKAVTKREQSKLDYYKAVNSERKKDLKAELEAIKEKRRENQRLAQMNVKNAIQERLAKGKEREKDADDWEDVKRRAIELEKRQQRGVKLSKKDQKWLAAAQAINKAKKAVKGGKLARRQKEVKNQLDAAKQSLRKLDSMNAHLAQIRADNKKLLTY